MIKRVLKETRIIVRANMDGIRVDIENGTSSAKENIKLSLSPNVLS